MAYDVTQNLESPANAGEAVDISSTDHTATHMSRAVYVGTAGNLKVDLRGTSAITFTNVQDGTVLPIRVSKVYRTGTTASNITLLW